MTLFSDAKSILTPRGASIMIAGTALVQRASATISESISATATATTNATMTINDSVVTTLAKKAPPAANPHYGALIALIGLGAVAFIVVRRHSTFMENFCSCPNGAFRDLPCENPSLAPRTLESR
jgi:hypothetical protein